MAATCWIIYFLVVARCKSQRIILSTKSFTDADPIYLYPYYTFITHYTLLNGTSINNSNSGSFVRDPRCPDATQTCYRFSSFISVAQIVDLLGYTDVQVEYDIRTIGLQSEQFCTVCWFPINNGSAGSILANHITNEGAVHAVKLITPIDTTFSNPDDQQVYLDFHARFHNANGWCFINNVVVTGLPITPDPSAPPTRQPTAHPTAIPTTKAPTNTPSFTPTNPPIEPPTTNAPSNTPSFKPTNPPHSKGPTNAPSFNPTEVTEPPHGTPTTKRPTSIPSSNPTGRHLYVHLTPYPSAFPSVIHSVYHTSLDAQITSTKAAQQNGDGGVLLISAGVVACIVLLICVVCFVGLKFVGTRKDVHKKHQIESEIDSEAVDPDVNVVNAKHRIEMIDPGVSGVQVTGGRLNIAKMRNALTPSTRMGGNTKQHSNTLEVQRWLEDVVHLPQYFDVFMSYGYETMAIVEEIRNIQELMEIGIVSRVHQMRILMEIENWRNGNVLMENQKQEGSHWADGEKKMEQTVVVYPNIMIANDDEVIIGNDETTTGGSW
eukprot:445656_1